MLLFLLTIFSLALNASAFIPSLDLKLKANSIFASKATSTSKNDVENDLEAISIAKSFVSSRLGTDLPSILTDDVVYVNPSSLVVGKAKYLAKKEKELKVITNILPNFSFGEYGFQVDESNRNKVYVKLRPNGKFTEALQVGQEIIPPTNEPLFFPIESLVLTIDPSSNKIAKIDSGYPLDRLTGNTVGLSGLQGIKASIGLVPSQWEYLPPLVIFQRFIARSRKPINKGSILKSPFPESVMISLARQVVATKLGVLEPALLSEYLQVSDPFLGPIVKADYLAQQQLSAAAEVDIVGTNYLVDSIEPDRVWVSITYQTSDGSISTSPEMVSLSFDKNGLCYRITQGYTIDRKAGNTQGISGIYGLRALMSATTEEGKGAVKVNPLQTFSVSGYVQMLMEEMMGKLPAASSSSGKVTKKAAVPVVVAPTKSAVVVPKTAPKAAPKAASKAAAPVVAVKAPTSATSKPVEPAAAISLPKITLPSVPVSAKQRPVTKPASTPAPASAVASKTASTASKPAAAVSKVDSSKPTVTKATPTTATKPTSTAAASATTVTQPTQPATTAKLSFPSFSLGKKPAATKPAAATAPAASCKPAPASPAVISSPAPVTASPAPKKAASTGSSFSFSSLLGSSNSSSKQPPKPAAIAASAAPPSATVAAAVNKDKKPAVAGLFSKAKPTFAPPATIVETASSPAPAPSAPASKPASSSSSKGWFSYSKGNTGKLTTATKKGSAADSSSSADQSDSVSSSSIKSPTKK